MGPDVVSRETLRHNPLNAVTAVVERVRRDDGRTLIHKRLRAPTPSLDSGSSSWAGSTAPRHWNYWHREADAYRSEALRRSLVGTGLSMADAEVEDSGAAVDLWLEDVVGTPGTEFTLEDHRALATGLGRWQARGPLVMPWTSQRFLRDYSASKAVAYEVLADDAAWAAPLIRATWPPGLRAGWVEMVSHREELLTAVEQLPRTRSHLDVWVANQVRRPGGEVVLLDWAFVGDGAVGEDLGNHIPDAAFDLFWPAGDLSALEETCFNAYIEGLGDGGWPGTERDVRLAMTASAVKYVWLLPMMLSQARDSRHTAYHHEVETEHLYRQRGIVFAHLVRWHQQALALLHGG
jgi:hypothetical protein